MRFPPLALLPFVVMLASADPSAASAPLQRPPSPQPQTQPQTKPDTTHMRAPEQNWTPLDRYVAQPDPAFGWEVVARDERPEVRTYLLRLTSQRWRRAGEVSDPLWTHWLRIAVPRDRRHDLALLVIGGGSRPGERAAEVASELLSVAAQRTGCVAAELTNVPNQPLGLVGGNADAGGLETLRYEDDIIAESWARALETGDLTWAVQLPMVKSATAAMTAVEQFLAGLDEPITPDGFALAGASKRGWTTWLAAAVDDRVVAIAPLVIPILNMVANFRHHFEAYGFFSPPLRDYEARGLAGLLGSPEFDRLAGLVDPYAYRDRLTMPKYVVNAASDEFFVLDSDRFFYDDLPGESRLWVVPRAGHGVQARPDVLPSVVSFFSRIADARSRGAGAKAEGGPRGGGGAEPADLPSLDWRREGDELIVRPSREPRVVYLWRATNPDARDFRTVSIGDAWSAEEIEPEPDGSYRVRLAEPERGWRAHIIEATFLDPEAAHPPLLLSTPAYVLPDALPFAGQPLE